MTAPIENFGRNVRLNPSLVYQVDSETEVLAVLTAHRGRQIRAIGSLHAWSDAVQADDVLIETQSLNSVEIDESSRSVWVGAGCKVKRLLRALSLRGLTLPSIGLIDEQSVAGATATGTHGSGSNSLSHFVTAIRVAHYDSDGKPVVSQIESGDELKAARCSLGMLGIVVAVQMQCRRSYNIKEIALSHRSLSDVIAMESSHPKQQFYLMPWSWTWYGHHRAETDEDRSRLATLYRIYCLLVIDFGLHVAVAFLSRVFKSAAAIRFFFRRVLPLTIISRWSVVDNSHAMLVMEHELFRHIEIEVFVPRSKVQQATDLLIDVVSVFGGKTKISQAQTDQQLESARKKHELESLAGSYCHHYPICYRRIEPDETLLSASAPSDTAKDDEDWYAISFISYQKPDDRDGFRKFANFIGPLIAELFGGRCHWGKFNPLTQEENECLYPGLSNFKKIAAVYDPNGNFCNPWLKSVI